MKEALEGLGLAVGRKPGSSDLISILSAPPMDIRQYCLPETKMRFSSLLIMKMKGLCLDDNPREEEAKLR